MNERNTFSIMDARLVQHAVMLFVVLCVFCISDTSIAESPSPKPTRQTKKVEYEDDQLVFPYPMTTTIHQGNVPIVNPTTPGTTPIVNPISPPSPPTTTGPPGGGSWCIANPTASQTALQVALDYACGYGGADCSAIQPGGSCFDPSTIRDHASYAFNSYYQRNPIATSCVFGGAAQISYTNPSHGNCRYTMSTSTPTITPTIPITPSIPMTPAIPVTPMIPMTPPGTTSPVNPFTPGGNGVGMEPGIENGFGPTGNPSSAEAISLNLLLLMVVNFLISSNVLANYF